MRLRPNDEAEFTAMIQRHAHFVFRIAYSLLRNPQDAEDAVQEMLLNLYRRRAWLGLRDERAFLARSVWRIALDKLRQSRKEMRNDAVAVPELASYAPDPERSALGSDWIRHVHMMVDRLPEELRQPLALSTVDELNSREVAEIMGIPEGTVRSRLVRARQLLRIKLAAREEVPHARTRK